MELTQKGEMVTRLQAKACQIGKILSNLEKKGDPMTDSQISTINSFTGNNSLSPPHTTSSGPPNKKPHLKIGTIPPFNANKIRKSPSVGVTTTASTAPVEPSVETASTSVDEHHPKTAATPLVQNNEQKSAAGSDKESGSLPPPPTDNKVEPEQPLAC